MSDADPNSGIPAQDGNHNGGDQSASGHAQKNEGKKLAQGNLNGMVIVESLTALGFFGPFGDMLNDFGIHNAKPVCNILGVCAIELAIAHLAYGKSKKKWIWVVLVALVSIEVLSGGLIARIKGHPAPTPAPSWPRFEYSIATASDQVPVPLTNSFLFKPFKNAGSVTNFVDGFLVVSVESGEKSIALQLFARNASETIAEDAQIVFLYPVDWHVSAPGWDTGDSDTRYSNPPYTNFFNPHALIYHPSYSTHPGDTWKLPPITIKDFDSPPPNMRGLVAIYTKIKDAKDAHGMTFNLLLRKKSKDGHSKVVLGKEVEGGQVIVPLD